MTEQKVVFAPQDRIDGYEQVGTEFLRDVLDLEWSACLVTDESRLSDFSSTGMPEELSEPASSLEALYDAWDTWVTVQVRERYGIDLATTTLYLVDLFELIEQGRRETNARQPGRLN